MVRQCSGITRQGQRCTVSVGVAQEFCHLHDPSRASERRRSASRAGKAKVPTREVHELKAELRQLKDDVLGGSVERGNAAVVVQVVRVLRDLIELERRIKETDELEERLQALETKAKQGGSAGWG